MASFLILLFLLGLCIGSFINAAEYRLALGEKLVHDRSRCRSCKKVLPWFDLIPVISFAWLRGRCRACREPISWQYPAVELVTGCLFVAAFIIHPVDLETPQALLMLLRDLLIVATCVFLFVYDGKYSLLPDAVTLPAVVVMSVFSLSFGMPVPICAAGVVVGGGFFLLQYLLSKGRWVGGGDIRFGAMMGAIFGWPLVLISLFISYFLGAIVGIGLLATRKKRAGDAIPFGTFLALGTLATLWWGAALADWYAHWL